MFKIIKKSKLEEMEQEIKTLCFISENIDGTNLELIKINESLKNSIEFLEKQNELLKCKSKEDALVYEIKNTIFGYSRIFLYRVIKGEFIELERVDYSEKSLKKVEEVGFISKLEYTLKNLVGDKN